MAQPNAGGYTSSPGKPSCQRVSEGNGGRERPMIGNDHDGNLHKWLDQFPLEEQEDLLRLIHYLCSDQSYYDDINDPDFSIFVHLDLILHGYNPDEMNDAKKVEALKRIQRVEAAKLN
jgi:hypothetical protein